MKKNLENAYAYQGKVYGPGEADIPDSILEAEDLSPAFKADIEDQGEKAPEPPSIDTLESVPPGLSAEMKANGYNNVEDIKQANDKDLTDTLTSLDKAQLKAIRQELKES